MIIAVSDREKRYVNQSNTNKCSCGFTNSVKSYKVAGVGGIKECVLYLSPNHTEDGRSKQHE